MKASDRTEKVLREFHVLFSKAEPYEGSSINVVVNKNDVMELLKELNSCMYDMMDEYELTTQSHDKAKRKMQKEGDEIIFNASRKAEDIYAASIMYTDNALNNISDIMNEADDEIAKIYKDVREKIKEEEREIKRNQSDLKAKLQDLIDTQKYLMLIEDENRRLAKEKDGQAIAGSSQSSQFADIKPEIKINEEYFRQAGIPLEKEDTTMSEEEIAKMSNDLDKEYFEWKEEEKSAKEEKKEKGFSFFGKKG